MVVRLITDDHSFFIMKKFFLTNIFILLLIPFSFAQVKNLETGADRLLAEYSNILKNQRIGLVTNAAGVLSNNKPLYKVLKERGYNVTRIFTPEHGFYIDKPAGGNVNDTSVSGDKIPVTSLYGVNKAPTREMFSDFDILIFDLQDVGARFYTYISTLYYTMQAAAKYNIRIIVLDRPNPINGLKVAGPVLKEDMKSFVGIAPLPVEHGMTIGEIARYFDGENLLGKGIHPDLYVISMKNWNRNSYFDDYSKKWIPPSPNIRDIETALIYPGTCLIEGTNVSEGRGTFRPFLTIGAPFINSNDLIEKLQDYGINGIEISPIRFSPISIPAMAENPKYENEKCYGISISIADRSKLNSVQFGIKLICALQSLYPDKFKTTDYFDKLSGNPEIRKMVLNGASPGTIIRSWEKELTDFKNIRRKYLLY